MLGSFINAAALLIGSVLGVVLRNIIPETLRKSFISIFGLSAFGIGIILIFKVSNLPVIVLSMLIGYLIGALLNFENNTKYIIKICYDKFNTTKVSAEEQENYANSFVALIVLFCISVPGIIGSLMQGINGDSTLLIAKAIIDFFTAIIFASYLGLGIIIIIIPMLLSQYLIFAFSQYVEQFTTASVLNDFSAVGGLILVATGLRVCEIKSFSVVDMFPALLFSIPLSIGWGVLFS